MNRRTVQRNWIARERVYTNRYSRRFYKLLQFLWRRSAKQFAETGNFEIKDEEFLPLYRDVYDKVTLRETRLVVAAQPKDRKDVLDALATLFNGSGPETITFVRNLMQQHFNVYVMSRLREVSDLTRRQILRTIQEGFDQGLGGRDIARLMRQRAPELNRVRAIRIARTESVTAANRAQILAHEASPYVYEKAWLAVQDKRTRLAHKQMDPTVFLELWDPFFVDGEELIAPGDTTASAKNVVNCRCVLLFRAKRGADGRLIRKENLL